MKRPVHFVISLALLVLLLPFGAWATDFTIFPQYADTVWVSLGAGDYAVQVIDGGWSAWDHTTCTEPLGCPRTCPTTVTGWLANYRVVSPDLTSVSVDGVWLPPLPGVPQCVGLPVSYFVQSAGNTFYKAEQGLVFPDPQAAIDFAPESAFTLGNASLVGFTLTNVELGDNRGSLTLRVSSGPVPVEGNGWGGIKASYR